MNRTLAENYFPYIVKESVAIIEMNRFPVNSLDFEFLRQLGTMSEEMSRRDAVRAVLITSKFKVFGAGLDLKMAAKMSKDQWHNYTLALHDSFNRLENIPKPVVAAVNGPALAGGLLICLSCDFRFMGEKKAYFGLPEVNLGIPYLAGVTKRLPALIGRANAIDLMFTGRKISAYEAKKIGLINKVFKDKELLEKSFGFAKMLASKGRHSIAAAKKCLNESLYREVQANLALEHEAVNMTVETDEIMEGYASFLDRRDPDFLKLNQ
jgi:enoyl-CoA hydratase/carnithine racemase